MRIANLTALVCLLALPAVAQETDNPFPEPIEPDQGVVVVEVAHHTVLLDIVRSKREEQGRDSADRVDLRIAEANGEIYLLNKYDGVLRRLVP